MLHSRSYLAMTVAALAAVLLSAAWSQADEPRELLKNPSAEKAVKGKVAAWFPACIPAEGLKAWWCTDEAAEGKASLAISNTHVYAEKVHNNWAQHVTRFRVGQQLQFSAQVKTSDAQSVNICVQCWDREGKKMLAFASSPIISGTQDWKPLETTPVQVPDGTATIVVRAVLTGTGTVWFDDLSLKAVHSPDQGTEGDRK
jgi:hypothetical protein